ncbi:MAG: hypothetical protein Q7S61_06475 [bacterium]|nr:hypothetical protein [bacterium]
MTKIYEVNINETGRQIKELSSGDSFKISQMIFNLKDQLIKASLALTMFERSQISTDPFIASLPFSYQIHLHLLYAHAFIFALDEIDKTMSVLESPEKMPNIPLNARLQLTKARLDLSTLIPGIKSVRDSAHHVEDRIRLKGNHEKKILPQPVTIPGLFTHQGDVLMVSCLIDNRLSYTAGDGSLQMIEISETVLKHAQSVVQKVFDGFEWF